MKKYIATALLPLLLMLGACGGVSEGEVTNGIPSVETTKGRIIVENDPDMVVYKFTIDGVTCVALDAYQAAGLTCDFE